MTVIFLKRPEIEQRTGLKRSTIYDKIKAGTFPKPVKLGARAVAWPEAEVEAWMKERIAHRGGLN
jgi:prophage regulatory protein